MKRSFFSPRNFIVTIIGLLMVGFLFLSPQQVAALVTPVQPVIELESIALKVQSLKAEVKETIWNAVVKAARTSFLNSLRSLANQFAYDTATYIGSGGKGQKPVYFTKEFGPWLQEQGANVGGQFIEEFAKTDEGSFIKKYDICSPDLSVHIKISLGLTDYASKSRGLSQSRCNLKEIYESGRDQVELYRDPEYLKNLALTAFHPSTTDIGAALTLNDEIGYRVRKEKEGFELQRLEDKGWISPQGIISNERTAPPGIWELKLKEAKDLQVGTFFDRTGDVFVDATAIFLNQLALRAFNKLIDNLSKNTSSSSSSSSNYYSQGGTGGITEVARQNSSILQAQFNERADYDVLSRLSACRDEENPGPTECVINQQFAQAIEQNLTVAEAIQKGLLNGNARVGYNTRGDVMSYNEGYPYRSLIILRKYRVLPVGWEVAAQYIRGHSEQTKDVTLSDLVACFSPSDKSYPGLDEEWCRGLVDPHWVLKLPKMFCGMEGYGSQLLGATVYKNPTEDRQGNVEVSVTRNNNYCADEQSCIKENSNGTCDIFGYCTQEKRRWIFSQNPNNSCEPRNNTCQTFKNESGQEAAFLENTLDYNFCDAGQVGCKQYALSGLYDKETKKIDWDGEAKQVYFNKNVSACGISDEGCHQYFRTKDNLDTNLIGDASFEDSECNKDEEGVCQIQEVNPGPGAPGIYNLNAPNDRWYILVNDGLVKAGIVQTEVDDGTQSLYIEGSGTLFSNPAGPGITPHSFLPENFQFEPGHYYTLSARVFPKTSAAFAGFGLLGANHVDSTVLNQWQTLVVTFYYPFGTITDNRIFVGSRGGIVYVDSVKLTAGRASTTYNDYGSRNVINQKILPTYLEDTCYQFNVRVPYRLKTDAPEECYKFAKKCNANEVGCELFTSLDTGIAVTAKTTAQDSCPGTCVGYNTYVQQANAFNAKQAVNLIPATAKTCGAQAVGCTAFTNLDKLSQGGEAIEYYSAMRKCIKPDASRCLPFYTWEGSDESGYQLKVYSLQRDPGSRGEEPLSTLPATEEALLCNASIYQKLPSEPGYNYDCRQFYAQDGTVSYHLYQKTISCSDDCHPYRRELNTASSCLAGNGEWDATQSRCLYYAIPGEGTICAAADAGCQEYTGNIASNTRNIFTVSTFEDNNNAYEGWEDRRELVRTNTALNLGGHSLLGNTFTKLVGEGVKRNKSYTVSFLARASVPTAISNIELFNGARPLPDRAIFSTSGTNITTDWKLYSFNLTTLDHEVTSIPRPSNLNNIGEKLKLSFANEVFIDNIRLTEVPNRFYLISNSWTIPDECDEDLNGSFAPGYMLGCSQYKNADSITVNLHSFTDLCDDASAGCEALIDTFNSNEYKAKIVNDDNDNKACDPNEKSCIYTPADKIVYAIYDRTKQCEVANKGCQRMGLASTYDTDISFSDIYINNNPDRYGTVACKAEAVGCSKWTSPDGDTYFKDPGKEVCEWRLKTGTTNQYEWYKKDIKRCDGVGAICTSNSDCGGTRQVCTDAPCTFSYDKTIGIGGKVNVVKQPTVDSNGRHWAGLCQVDQADCTEYIDPISRFNENLIINPGFKQLDTTSNIVEGWTWTQGSDEASQFISLNPQTLYILKGSLLDTSSRMRVKISCPDVEMQVLQENNNFVNQTAIDYNGNHNSSAQFYFSYSRFRNLVTCKITINKPGLSPNPNDSVYLLKANIDYQIAKNLDRVSHNNLVNFEKGAVLFNERSQNGKDKSRLLYNADSTYDTTIDGASPSTENVHNANVLLKVQPDRVCSKWLDCLSYIPDANNPNNKTCLDIGECEAFAADGSCASRVSNKRENFSNLESILNTTGYSKVGYRDNLYNSFSDYYHLSAMSQVGETVKVPNSGFEEDNNDDWILEDSGAILESPTQISSENLNSLYKLTNQQRGVNYLAPEGDSILKINVNKIVKSKELITGFQANRRYVLTLYTYGQGGDLKIGLKNDNDEDDIEYILNIDKTDHPHQWVKRSVGFKANSSSYRLVFNNGDNFTYIDDIKIESALNIRCSDSGASPENCVVPTLEDNDNDPQPEFVGPSCRLYPTENALSCRHTDENNITTNGLKGYCLEPDPRNPAVCLLWYPVDRIASDSIEEGGGVNFNDKSVYYCLNAQDECSAKTPELYCDQFVKVDTDKYWAARLDEDSSLKLPNKIFPESPFFYPSDTRKIDFGGSVGPINIFPIPRRATDNYFGALVQDDSLSTTRKNVTVEDSMITSFLPYFGTVNRKMCMDDRQPINILFTSRCGDGRCIYDALGNRYPDGGSRDYVDTYWAGTTEEGDYTVDIPGTWDICVPQYAMSLDYRGGGDNRKPIDIQDGENLFRIKKCSLTEADRHLDGSFNCDTDCRNTNVPCQVFDQSSPIKNCRTEPGGNGTWKIIAKDGASTDDVGCMAQCYNRIKEVSVTKPKTLWSTYALDVIKRLFPKTDAWRVYKWNGGSYAPHSTTLPLEVTKKCPDAGRPQIDDATDQDYCYILPQIFDYYIEGQTSTIIVNGRQTVTLAFSTKTDPEQKPLKDIYISLGYNKSLEVPQTYNRTNQNFADINPRYFSHEYNYTQINKTANEAFYRDTRSECDGADSCYIFTPEIRIKDNWDKEDVLNDNEMIKIMVKQPS